MHDHLAIRRRAALAVTIAVTGLGLAACGSSGAVIQPPASGSGKLPGVLLFARPRYGSVDGIPNDDIHWLGHRRDMKQDERTGGTF